LDEKRITMLAKRIIPCLDVTGGRVVKGVNFVELRDAGDPVEIAARYNEQGADELTFLDITATSDGRDMILHIIEAVASQVFIPLTVGGGVRTVEVYAACSMPALTRPVLTQPRWPIRKLFARLLPNTALSASWWRLMPSAGLVLMCWRVARVGMCLATAVVKTLVWTRWLGRPKWPILARGRFCSPA
jgi:hypothetical protein